MRKDKQACLYILAFFLEKESERFINKKLSGKGWLFGCLKLVVCC